MLNQKPTREMLRSKLIPGKSKGARRHNRNVLAKARQQWHNTFSPKPVQPKKLRKEHEAPKPVIMQMYASAVWQQAVPGQCPVCTGKASTAATVKLLDKGTTEQVRKCANKFCDHYFREYVAPVAQPKPVAAKPSLPEVDDVFMLAVWPTHGCATCACQSYRSVQVNDKYDGVTKTCVQCDACHSFYKTRSW